MGRQYTKKHILSRPYFTLLPQHIQIGRQLQLISLDVFLRIFLFRNNYTFRVLYFYLFKLIFYESRFFKPTFSNLLLFVSLYTAKK